MPTWEIAFPIRSRSSQFRLPIRLSGGATNLALKANIMQHDRFDTPIVVKSEGKGGQLALRTAREARDYLLTSWPGKKSERYRAAIQACHDAELGEKPAMAARRALRAAPRTASMPTARPARSATPR